MPRPRIPAAARVAAALLLLAGCQAGAGSSTQSSVSASDGPGEMSAPPASVPASEPGEADADVLVASDPDLGQYLTDTEGRTLYVFTNDMQGMSHCVGECADSWPPFALEPGAAPTGGDGLTGSLATIEREDGSLQVTLDGWPLYHFAGDAEPGEVNGEGMNDAWYVARPDGSLPGDSPSQAPDDYYQNY